MNAFVEKTEQSTLQWITPVIEFAIERLAFASLSALITYALYRLFLL